jgi:hypothetical protein
MGTRLAMAWVSCVLLCGGASAQSTLAGEEDVAIDDEVAADDGGAGSPIDTRASAGLAIGGKVGLGLGAPFNDFGGTPVLELELGYLPELGGRRALEIFLSGQYTQPGVDGSAAEPDPRVPGSEPFSYEVTQQMLSLGLGVLYHIDVGSELLMPYGGLGGRMYLLRTQASTEVAGQAVADSDETQTSFGLVLLGGVELFLGPGALLAELSFGWAGLDAYIMRDTNLGALSLSIGYRVFL